MDSVNSIDVFVRYISGDASGAADLARIVGSLNKPASMMSAYESLALYLTSPMGDKPNFIASPTYLKQVLGWIDYTPETLRPFFISIVHRRQGIVKSLNAKWLEALESFELVEHPTVRDNFGIHIYTALAYLSRPSPNMFLIRDHLNKALTHKPSPDAKIEVLIKLVANLNKGPLVSAVLIPTMDAIWSYPHHTETSKAQIKSAIRGAAFSGPESVKFSDLECANEIVYPMFIACDCKMLHGCDKHIITSLMSKIVVTNLDAKEKMEYFIIQSYLSEDIVSLENILGQLQFFEPQIRVAVNIKTLMALFSLHQYTDGAKAAYLAQTLLGLSLSNWAKGYLILWLIGYYHFTGDKTAVNNLCHHLLTIESKLLDLITVSNQLSLFDIASTTSSAIALEFALAAVHKLNTRKPEGYKEQMTPLILYMLRSHIARSLTTVNKRVINLLSELMHNPAFDAEALSRNIAKFTKKSATVKRSVLGAEDFEQERDKRQRLG